MLGAVNGVKGTTAENVLLRVPFELGYNWTHLRTLHVTFTNHPRYCGKYIWLYLAICYGMNAAHGVNIAFKHSAIKSITTIIFAVVAVAAFG